MEFVAETAFFGTVNKDLAFMIKEYEFIVESGIVNRWTSAGLKYCAAFYS